MFLSKVFGMTPESRKTLANRIGYGLLIVVAVLIAFAFVKSCGEGPILGDTKSSAKK